MSLPDLSTTYHVSYRHEIELDRTLASLTYYENLPITIAFLFSVMAIMKTLIPVRFSIVISDITQQDMIRQEIIEKLPGLQNDANVVWRGRDSMNIEGFTWKHFRPPVLLAEITAKEYPVEFIFCRMRLFKTSILPRNRNGGTFVHSTNKS
jgi:hypothetical protein